jgi:hypothetical protein
MYRSMIRRILPKVLLSADGNVGFDIISAFGYRPSTIYMTERMQQVCTKYFYDIYFGWFYFHLHRIRNNPRGEK